MTLPTDSKARKSMPLFSGCLMYFPDALLAVAEHSRKANDKHNPGEPLGWSKDKSKDHADCVARHLVDIGPEWDAVDPEFGSLHAVALAWRALALAQTVIERKRAGATLPYPPGNKMVISPLVTAFHPARAFLGEPDGPSSIPEFLKKHKE